jgi:hypothetical protein
MNSLSTTEIQEILEGHEDVLTPIAEQRQNHLAGSVCSHCLSPSIIYDDQHPDSFLQPGGDILCLQCGRRSTI